MYQFSLNAYSSLFHLSLSDSPKPEALADRIKALNDSHTYAVYKYASRGLFEQHKLLLSLQMCARILQASGQITAEEWQFFLQVGGWVLNGCVSSPSQLHTPLIKRLWSKEDWQLDAVSPCFPPVCFSAGWARAGQVPAGPQPLPQLGQ